MAKSFVETLREVRDGDLVSELSEKVRQLVEAVQGTQKAGKLTLSLTLRPMRKGTNMLELVDDVKVALPEPDKETSTLVFATSDNELTRRDPRQPELPGVRGVVTAMPPPAPMERAEGQ